MLLTDAPDKLIIPFAEDGGKNTIPVDSQIGITPGAASLADGFPPLTRTPLAAGGVPPSGLDMNGILFEISAITRWANAGGGYPYDATFATDTDVDGYPQGARVLRADGLGYWLNTVDDNTTDPDAGGAGWVPDFAPAATAVTMTSSNVTLTAVQYGQPIIVISGLMTADLNLIFPAIPASWVLVNLTTGGYTITAKTAAGTGVPLSAAMLVVGDGTNIYTLSQNQPAFSVNRNNVNQTGIVTATLTKIQFDTEMFDTNNDFDSTTNYRFTPTVAGKYLITCQMRFNNATDQSESWCAIYKNGALFAVSIAVESGATATQTPHVSAIIDMNGTTDYIEFYCYQNTGTNRDLVGVQSQTFATGMRIG